MGGQIASNGQKYLELVKTGASCQELYVLLVLIQPSQLSILTLVSFLCSLDTYIPDFSLYLLCLLFMMSSRMLSSVTEQSCAGVPLWQVALNIAHSAYQLLISPDGRCTPSLSSFKLFQVANFLKLLGMPLRESKNWGLPVQGFWLLWALFTLGIEGFKV